MVADLLGVPREDHETFRGWLGGARHGRRTPKASSVAIRCSRTWNPTSPATSSSAALRRGEDVMSRLASVRFPDGELPEVMDVVRLATILFAAGQETTARLLCAGMRLLVRAAHRC